MKTITYTTIEGQRWDNIAEKAYGNAGKSKDIIEANPDVPVYDILPAGTILQIPIKEEEDVTTSSEALPPWLQPE